MFTHQFLTDIELLSLLKADDHLAFEEIYCRYWKNLLTVAARKLKDHQEAEDVLNDVFVSLWNRRNNMPHVVSLNNYLKGALRFQVLKVWARKHQESKFQAVNGAILADSNTFQDSLNLKELDLEIKNAVLNLPEKCRTVFEMSREDGMTQKQISFRLGISQKTVEAHISKAIKLLRSSLRHHFLFFF